VDTKHFCSKPGVRQHASAQGRSVPARYFSLWHLKLVKQETAKRTGVRITRRLSLDFKFGAVFPYEASSLLGSFHGCGFGIGGADRFLRDPGPSAILDNLATRREIVVQSSGKPTRSGTQKMRKAPFDIVAGKISRPFPSIQRVSPSRVNVGCSGAVAFISRTRRPSSVFH